VSRGELPAFLDPCTWNSGAMVPGALLSSVAAPYFFDEEARLESLAADTHIELKPPTPEQETGSSKNNVFLDGADVTDPIRTGDVAQRIVAGDIAGVRHVLVAEQQRRARRRRGDGRARYRHRCFPNAELKIFPGCFTGSRAQRALERAPEKGDDPDRVPGMQEFASETNAIAERKVRLWCGRLTP